MNRCLLTLLFGLLTVNAAHALTLREVAGVYVGTRLDRFGEGLLRYDMIMVLEPDGFLTMQLFAGDKTYTTPGGLIEIARDGTITRGGGNHGRMRSNGASLDIWVSFNDLNSLGKVTVQIESRRIKKLKASVAPESTTSPQLFHWFGWPSPVLTTR